MNVDIGWKRRKNIAREASEQAIAYVLNYYYDMEIKYIPNNTKDE